MQATREAEFKPVLKGKIIFQPINYYYFAIVNTGKGAAHNIEAEWGVDGVGTSSTWRMPHIAPGEQHRFSLPLSDDENDRISAEGEIKSILGEYEGILHYEAECEDALGNSHSFVEDIPILDAIEGRLAASEILQRDELEKIRRTLDDIPGAIEDVAGEIELSGFDEIIRAKQNELVLDALRKHDEVFLQELRDISGLTRTDLATVLRRLERTGMIEIEDGDTNLFHREAEGTIRLNAQDE